MKNNTFHYMDVIMSAMTSQITSLTIVYSTAYSGVDQRKHQSYASLAFVMGIHRWPVNSPHKGPVTRKMFPFDDDMSSDFHHNSSESVVVLVVTHVKQFYFILNVCKFFIYYIVCIECSAFRSAHRKINIQLPEELSSNLKDIYNISHQIILRSLMALRRVATRRLGPKCSQHDSANIRARRCKG